MPTSKRASKKKNQRKKKEGNERKITNPIDILLYEWWHWGLISLSKKIEVLYSRKLATIAPTSVGTSHTRERGEEEKRRTAAATLQIRCCSLDQLHYMPTATLGIDSSVVAVGKLSTPLAIWRAAKRAHHVAGEYVDGQAYARPRRTM